MFGSLVAVLGVVFGLLDARTVKETLEEAGKFRRSGAATWVLSADNGVSGEACVALASVAGIPRAGALRWSSDVRLVSTPRSPISVAQTTASFLAMLNDEVDAHANTLAASSIADRYAMTPLRRVPTTEGGLYIDGTFEYPEDGRRPGLEAALVEVVPTGQVFDECWFEVWPTDEATVLLGQTSVLPESRAEVELTQLNGRLGERFPAIDQIEGRATRHVSAVALASGMLVGLGGVRLRRIEMASNLHAGVPRSALLAQSLVEVSIWAAAGGAVAGVVLWRLVAVGAPEMVSQIVFRLIGLTVVGAVVGTCAMTGLSRERQLFKFFNER